MLQPVDGDEAIIGSHGDVHRGRLLSTAIDSPAGDALPGHELEAAHAVGDVGLAVGDLLGLGAGRGAEDDHAGAEAIAGVVEERAGADQDALGFEVVDELVMRARSAAPC